MTFFRALPMVLVRSVYPALVFPNLIGAFALSKFFVVHVVFLRSGPKLRVILLHLIN
jgi:hypothetical protein